MECRGLGSYSRGNVVIKYGRGLGIWKNIKCIKKVKKEAKEVVSDAKCKACDDLYNKLGTREGENDIFKIREMKSRDLDHGKCIKSNDQRFW